MTLHQLWAELETSHTADKNNQQVPEPAKIIPFCEKEQCVGNDFDLSPAPFESRKKISDFMERKVLARHLLIKCILCSITNVKAGVATSSSQRKINPWRC